MTDLSPQLLAELSNAISVSGGVPYNLSTRDWFGEVLSTQIHALLDREEGEKAHQIFDEGHRGVLASRERDLDAAARHFNVATDLLERGSLSKTAIMLAESILSTQKAYLDHCRQEDGKAFRQLEASFNQDIALEDKGFVILRAHRLQVLTNLMRIHARRDCFHEALTIGCLLLKYLETGDNLELSSMSPPWNQNWPLGWTNIPADLVVIMHAQAAGELTRLVGRWAEKQVSQERLANTLESVWIQGRNDQINLWLRFQTTRFGLGDHEALRAAIPVLRRGRVPSEPLWLSVAQWARRVLDEV